MTIALIAGATGMLGSRIGHFLVDQPDVTVRLLVRDGWADDPGKRTRVEPLIARGATIATGDVSDAGSLDAAVRSVDVVISALQGKRDVIVDGQLALAEAAVGAGVRRFIASDYATDLFNAPAGAPQFEARKDAARLLKALNLQVLHVLNGAFMDLMFNPNYPGPVDLASGTVTFWGTGDELFDLATVDDTARFTARLAVDPHAESGVHTISAGPTTYKEIARTVERATGKRLSLNVLGDDQQLREAIEAKSDPWDAVMEWYSLGMMKTPAWTRTENNRYPDAMPILVEEYLMTAYGNAQD